jgi:hypothetical protein
MRHTAHVAHHSRGRLRIRVPGAKGKPEALEVIRKSLASLNGVSEVEVNEAIGSVTIHYDPQQHPDFEKHLSSESCPQDAVFVEAAPKLQDMEELDDMIEHEAAFLAQHSHSAKLLFDWANGFDAGIKRLTGNAVDLKVLAPAAFAVAAFMELGITASTPIWLTLGLFSFNHFVDLHSHPMTTNPTGQTQAGDNAPPPRPRKKRFP